MIGTLREQTDHVDLQVHRNNGELLDEYTRLMEQVNEKVFSLWPEPKKISLSTYAYNTLKYGAGLVGIIDSLNEEFNTILGFPIEINESQQIEIEVIT